MTSTSSSSYPSNLDNAMTVNGALQQVFARCAEPVWKLVDQTMTQKSESPVKLVETQPPATHRASASSAASAASVSLASPTLQGFRPEVVKLLSDNELDTDEDLIKALVNLGGKTMVTIKEGLSQGVLTVEGLVKDGVKPLPAAVFIRAAKAVSRVEKEIGDIIQALLFPLPAFWFMM